VSYYFKEHLENDNNLLLDRRESKWLQER